jgi:hypothetical protein
MFAVVFLALLISVPVRADLHDPNNSADYIILTNQDVLSNNSWIDSLLDYREAQGRTVMAVTVEEIWDEFSPAGSDSAIREFLHFAYNNWQAPRLKDVFIIGHWNVVPSARLFSTFDSTTYRSDYLFTIPFGSENLDPLFAVGRLPWSPNYSLPLNSFFDKVQNYERSLPGTWINRCLLIADTGCSGSDCSELVEDYIAPFLPTSLEIERNYLDRPIGDPWHGECEDVWLNLNAGSLLTCAYAAGTFGSPMPTCGLYADDIAELTNFESLSVYCGPVRYALGPDSIDDVSVVLAGLNSTTGGFIAASVQSANSWAIAGSIHNRFLMKEIADPNQASLGNAWRTASTQYADSFVDSGAWTTYSATLYGTCFLGDPATIIPGRTTPVSPITAPVVPKSLSIVGNFPNPFNPSTTIRFQMNRAGLAKLTVYDITGRAVTTLADRDFAVGEHSVNFNAAGLASGIYIVRLESAGEFASQKITLLK